MTAETGPLTERQKLILDDTIEGLTQKEIARKRGLTLATVGRDNMLTVFKFNARKTAQAVATYSTAIAYQNAAAQVLSVRVVNPADETEEHVNHVLEGIASLFQDWAAQRLPK